MDLVAGEGGQSVANKGSKEYQRDSGVVGMIIGCKLQENEIGHMGLGDGETNGRN